MMLDQTHKNHLKVALSAARQCAKTDTMRRAIEALMARKDLSGLTIKSELAHMIPLADKDADFNHDWMTLAEVSEGIGEGYG